MILSGPSQELLRRFYAIRERVWLLENTADPYRGRQLRGLLERGRFERVTATRPDETATVMKFRDDRVVSMQDYRTEAEALAAAGSA